MKTRSHLEARRLWDPVPEREPDPLALCLMPDHIHLLHHHPVRPVLGTALGA